MRAMVTGAGGFLGQYIVEQLIAQGHEVRAFCHRSNDEIADLGAEVVVGDLLDVRFVTNSCRDMECVIHTAGIAGMGGPWKRYFRANTLGTFNVTEACRRRGVSKLVFTSSPSVIFNGSDLCGVDESVPYPRKWLGNYSQSKALAEQIVLKANGKHGVATCALRPHLIWGPRDRSLFPRLLEHARHGKMAMVGDGTNLIDTTYVENAAEAHILAAEALTIDSPVAGKAYFISQGEPVNCWQWVNRLLQIAGLPPIERRVTFGAAWKIGRAYEFFYWLFRKTGDPPMTRFMASQLAHSHYFNISRAKNDFGYTPNISTNEGVRRLTESENAKK